jgi:predicted PurR-regulated permease PerM
VSHNEAKMMLSLKSKKHEETVNFNITNRTIIRVLALVLLSLVVMGAIRQASHALVLIFTGLFLALALNAPVHWVATHIPGKRKGSRTAATAISFFVVIAFLAGFLALVVPPLVRQSSNFISAAPNIVKDVQDQDTTAGRFVQKYHLQSQVNKFSHQLSDRLGNIGGTAVNSIMKLGSSTFSVLTILVLTFMMLIEGPRWLRFLRDLIPDEHHRRADRLALDMYKVIKGYVNGQVVLAFIASAHTGKLDEHVAAAGVYGRNYWCQLWRSVWRSGGHPGYGLSPYCSTGLPAHTSHY